MGKSITKRPTHRVADVAGLKDLLRLTKSRFKKFHKRDNDLELIFHKFIH